MAGRLGIAYLDGPRLRRAILAACRRGRAAKAELNRINVFPVPDRDTGTNLALTLDAIADGLSGAPERRVDRVASAAVRSAVVAARGNVGMMLSQFLLGFARGLEGRERATAGEFGEAFERGARALYASVETPVEGTIITVVRDCADEASGPLRPGGAADFAEIMPRILATARESLARTPDLLPVLARAGVVDAGAMGFVEMIEGVAGLIDHRPAETAPAPRSATARRPIRRGWPPASRPSLRSSWPLGFPGRTGRRKTRRAWCPIWTSASLTRAGRDGAPELVED